MRCKIRARQPFSKPYSEEFTLAKRDSKERYSTDHYERRLASTWKLYPLPPAAQNDFFWFHVHIIVYHHKRISFFLKEINQTLPDCIQNKKTKHKNPNCYSSTQKQDSNDLQRTVCSHCDPLLCV